ncbi:MAG: transglutaminase-like domain-containing protein [Firmicutes bacterium]|nr:transglutaminase-like domain-containing protein [Bacillota bacterium]
MPRSRRPKYRRNVRRPRPLTTAVFSVIGVLAVWTGVHTLTGPDPHLPAWPFGISLPSPPSDSPNNSATDGLTDSPETAQWISTLFLHTPASGVSSVNWLSALDLAREQVENPKLTTDFETGDHAVQLRSVTFVAGSPNVLITATVEGLDSHTNSPAPRVVWLRVCQQRGPEPGATWVYPISLPPTAALSTLPQLSGLPESTAQPNPPAQPQSAAQPESANATHQAAVVNFSALIHVPFAAGTYQLALAPSLSTGQTNLADTFDLKSSSVSMPITLSFSGEDSDQQLGRLTSVWADWTDPQVASLAHRIAGHLPPLAAAEAVYHYEAAHISYDGNSLIDGDYTWSTAQETLASGEGICLDYANVAAALLRSLHVATQIVVGYARDPDATVADNGNTAHAWDRSWIGGRWVYFDPTWSREYFLPPGQAYPQPTDLYVYQPQWFNPPAYLLAATHKMNGVLDQ